MEVSKRIVLSTILVAMLVEQSYALPDWVKDNMVKTSTDSGYYETQTRGIYSLGSTSIRFKEMPGVITPFHVTPPRFNIGCGGIDISMGGFSYLNKEFLIEKLKAIGAAAPAFVYQMAFSALCKDCQNIMNELDKAANMINGLNFDTCDAVEAAQGLGKTAGEAMNSSLFGGNSDGWLSEKMKTGREKMEGWGNSLKSSLGLDETKKKDLMDMLVLEGSLLDLVAKKGISDQSKLELLGRDPNNDYLLLSAFRATVGDVVGTKDWDGNPTSYDIPGVGSTGDFFKVLYEGGDLQYNSNSTIYKRPLGTAETAYKWEGTKSYMTTKLNDIFVKMKAKQSLNATDKQFLAALPIPVYKFLNVSVITNSSKTDFDLIASQIAIEETKQMVSYLTRIVGRGMNTYVSLYGDKMEQSVKESALRIQNDVKNINEATLAQADSYGQELQVQKSVAQYIKVKEQEVKARLSQQSFYMSSL